MLPIQRQCDVENLADFNRYYHSSWVGWHPTDAVHIQPCFVGNMLSGDAVNLRGLTKQDNNQFTIEHGFPATWEEIKEHVDFGIPDIGMVQDGPTLLYCSYNTPRAAKKGYRGLDIRLSDFNSWDIRNKYVLRNNGQRYDWIWAAFNPEYPTLEQAEERLAQGEVVGVPISRTLGVYSLPKSRYSLLAYKRWTIGHVLTPQLIHLIRQYGDYEGDVSKQTGAEVVVV